MRLWICVHLPMLSLETLRPCWSEPGRHVVAENGRVHAASVEARLAGIRIGMKRAGVLVACPDAALHERDRERECTAYGEIALSLLQYTPEVALADKDSILLDVGASLRAFGGMRALFALVRANVLALGFTPQLAMAPTAHGAWLLAQAGVALARQRRAARLDTLVRRLDRLPYGLQPTLHSHDEWLDGIGCRTLRDVRRLPRAGLKRRCGARVLDDLDRAYGDAAELFEWIQAPETFRARLELPDRIEHAEGVMAGAQRLLLQMAGWLVAHQCAADRFLLAMEHERGRQAIPPTLIEIRLAQAAWQAAHLARLLKERLGRAQLTAPVIALRLEAVSIEPMRPPTETLFPEPGGSPADFRQLIELLAARLGEEGVLVPAPRTDHRPEICNRWLPFADGGRTGIAELPAAERPCWILEQPVELPLRDHRPFHGSPLRLIGPPERIEGGWWDDGLVMRDYFVAEGDGPAYYWIYRERSGDDLRWYLHGLFG